MMFSDVKENLAEKLKAAYKIQADDISLLHSVLHKTTRLLETKCCTMMKKKYYEILHII